MATYVNDLRLKEIGTGESSGTWGTETNTNLELIGEALGFGTEAITTNADTHTTTVADGSTDPGRAMYLKYTGTLDSACTITIAPNTISRMQFIENGTSGSQNIIISQGTGANVTIPPGDTKAVYLDGAGSGAAVVDAFASLSTVDLKVQDDLTVTDDASIGGDATVTGTLGVSGLLTANANITLAGTTPTLTIGDAGAEDTKIVFDGNAQDFYIALDDSADDLLVGLGSTVGTTPIISITEAGAVTLKNVGTGDDNPMSLTLQTSETDIAADDVLGKISFQAPDEGTGTDAILVAAAIQAISEGDFSASSNATSLAFMTGASEAAATKMTLTSAGKLGIGTANPSVPLDIVTNLSSDTTTSPDTVLTIATKYASTGSNGGAGAGPRLEFQIPDDETNPITGAAIAGIKEAADDSDASAGMAFYISQNDTTLDEAVRIDHDGKVGIGVTSPTGKLEIAATGTNAAPHIKLVESGDAREFNIYNDGSGNGHLVLADSDDDTSDTEIVLNDNGIITMLTGNSERMRIDSSGNVGIGAAATLGAFHVTSATNDIVTFENTSTGTVGSQLLLYHNSSSPSDGDRVGALAFQGEDDGGNHTTYGGIRCLAADVSDGSEDGTLTFSCTRGASFTEAMRIDSGGGVAIGTTTPDGVSNLTVKSQNTTPGQEFVSLHHQATSGLVYFISFMTESSGVDRGYITYNNSTNTVGFTQASDEILKENIRDLTGGLDFINQIKPRVFDWKEEGRGKDQVGFIAQEIETIKPEWVGEKEGHKNIPVDLPGTVPYLIKAIQEQQTQIEALQSEINTLKGE